jgi:hypothetical protein
MALRSLGWVPIALLGCGRVGFDPSTVTADAAIDSPDAMLAPLCDRVVGELYCNSFEGGGFLGADVGGATFVAGGGWNGSDGITFTTTPGQMSISGFTLPAVITGGELHIGGRMFMAAGPPSPNFVVIAQTITTLFEKISFDVNMNDRLQLVDSVGGAGGINGAEGSLPRDRWVCFELAIKVAPAGGGGRVELLFDEVSVLAGFDNVGTAPAIGFRRVEIGLISSTLNTASETLLFDNWIVSTFPIGCP